MSEDNPYHDLSMYKGALPESFLKAKNLRENMTEAEIILWEKLKDNRFEDYKFRRQHPINIYTVDFYCHELKLVIEVDGEYHTTEQQKLKDTERSEILVFQDLKILRFTNEEVLNNIISVLEILKQQIISNFTSKEFNFSPPLGRGKAKKIVGLLINFREKSLKWKCFINSIL